MVKRCTNSFTSDELNEHAWQYIFLSSWVNLCLFAAMNRHAAVNLCAGTAKFVTARDIGCGEQLSISYIDTTMGYAARQQQLEWAYGFRCACSLCTEEMQQEK